MATIQFSASLSYSNSAAGIETRISKSVSITQVGTDFIEGSQVIGTGGWEQLAFSADIGSVGPVAVVNLDGANYVELAYANDGTLIFAKLLAGEPIVLRPNSMTIYAKANTGACNVVFGAAES